MRVLRFLMWALSRSLLSLRYRIRLHGVEKIQNLQGPVLILPNHPGYIDPPIVLTMMYPLFHPRPLLFEGNFTGVLKPIAILLDALQVPDLDKLDALARQKTLEAIAGIKEALRQGENVILWPAGRLQRAGVEKLGAARTLSDVLRDVPNVKLVLVRTRGVWGSRFSWAWDAHRPPLVKRLLGGLGLLLANLLVFAPRRRVDLTLEVLEPAQLPGLEREVLNPYLEQWYNEGGGKELPTFVPAHFLFGPRTRDFPPPQAAEEIDLAALTEETRREVKDMVVQRLKGAVSEGKLTPEMTLQELGIDSMEAQELSLDVERRFGFQGDQVPATLGQLYALAAGLLRREPPKPPAPVWFKPPSTEKAEILGDTVAQAFVRRALACSRDVVCADDNSGVLTYERLLTGALLMARRFRDLPGTNIGLLLPSSVGCDVAMLGLYLAGKLPVVLNWTTGPANLAHAARIMGLKHVVTSKTFIQRVHVAVAGTEWAYLEDVRAGVGKLESLWTLLRVRWLPGSVHAEVPQPDPDSPAVVLFTSGSEKAPKAVPLTHRNILSNQQAGLQALQVTRHDAILGFLPAFHSFGMSITGLLPLLSGLRVVRHPDPTDAAALARKCGTYKPTILVGTPTFIGYILERAEPGELGSLRMAVVGAEKCPPALFERFARVAPGCQVLEGYGITECAPVVSVNPPGASKPGSVGKPLPGALVCVIDLDDDRLLPVGQMGLLLVSGPGIFPGYIGQEGEPPFRQRDGKRWYVTGDLVELDEQGYIHFRGRLKRFVKAGGEMISLPALEEPFARQFAPTQEGPRVAVEGVEIDGGRRIVLFTTEPISLREANDILLREGFHGVMRLDEVRRVDTIPVLGTGKTDYKVLRARILQEQRDGQPAGR